MEPPFLATELRKLLLWLTLECFRRNSFENRSIGLKELVDSLKNDRKWAWFCPKVGVASKNSRALRAQQYIRTPLLEILDPPLIYVPPHDCSLSSHGVYSSLVLPSMAVEYLSGLEMMIPAANLRSSLLDSALLHRRML